MDRRQFLKTLGFGLGATALVCSGVTVVGTAEPKHEFYESISNEGETAMTGKILVAYASFCGSTGEIAQAIADELKAQGRSVDVSLVKNVKSLDGYDQLIVGSAVRAGRWAPEAVDFVKKNQGVLAQKSTAFFTACATLEKDTPENRQAVSAYLDPIRELYKSDHEGFFAGKVEYNKLPFFFQLLGKVIKMSEGDFRNWEAIRAWARELI